MPDYTDEAFRAPVGELRCALHQLGRVRDAIDTQEPARHALDQEIEAIERSLDRLDAVLDEAIDELL
jgi:hypothetical protein